MKKNYIIPTAKFINLATEDALLVGSITGNEGTIGTGSGGVQESNHRTPSSSIWGDED